MPLPAKTGNVNVALKRRQDSSVRRITAGGAVHACLQLTDAASLDMRTDRLTDSATIEWNKPANK